MQKLPSKFAEAPPPPASQETQAKPWRERVRRASGRLKNGLVFGGGVLAALFGLLIFNLVNPPQPEMTAQQVSTVVQQAMASATPAPAYSSLVYRVIQPSLVLIQSEGEDRRGDHETGLGSGVVISNQGDILTALHVVRNATDIKVTFADGTTSKAVIAVEQPENDIAVLTPETLPVLLIPAVMGNPSAMQVGDEAYAVGNPFGLYGSISAGIVSGFERSFQAQDSERIEGLIQIDTAVNPGNSGGPLLNRYGQVVGIVIGILNPTEESFFVGIGFAVPITTAGSAAGAPQY